MAKKSTTSSDPQVQTPRRTRPENANGGDALTVENAVAKQKRTPKPTRPEKAAPSSVRSHEPRRRWTQDDIALRAYFIAEKRRLQGLPGDHEADWLEAERQLRAESGGGSSEKGRTPAVKQRRS